MDQLPKARADIQLIPAQMRGRQVIAVRDLLGLRKDVVVLAPEAVTLLPLFDGRHTIRDLQQTLMRNRGNQLVMREEAERIVRELDGLLLLQTPRYDELKQAVRKAFFEQADRPPALSGAAYPEDAEALRKLLAEMIPEDGPDPFGQASGAKILVAPHIDLKAGAAVYGRAYAAIRNLRPKRILVLGTGHTQEHGLISLTTKDYQTPLGSFPTDKEAVEKLLKAAGPLASPDDFAHRGEHSIELQVIFLRHLLEGEIPLVPLLFGSFGVHLDQVQRPAEIDGIQPLLECLKSFIDPDTLVVAGVDFSHVGPKFGHPHTAASYEEEVRDHDQKLLDALCRGSVTDFWAESRRVEDRYNVCGFPAMATLLEICPGMKGEVLDYQVWHEPPTRSAVSFAAVACTAV